MILVQLTNSTLAQPAKRRPPYSSWETTVARNGCTSFEFPLMTTCHFFLSACFLCACVSFNF